MEIAIAILIVLIVFFYLKGVKSKQEADNKKHSDYLANKAEQQRVIDVEVSINDTFSDKAEKNINISLEESISKSPFFCIFDIETTGLMPKYVEDIEDLSAWPNVVQLAWLITDSSNHHITHKSYYIKQNDLIPQQAIDIHGITNAICEKKGLPLKEVLELFLNDLKQVKMVVCHNYEFDSKILGVEFTRTGLKWPRKRKFCTMVKGKKHTNIEFNYSSKLKYPKLEELFGHFVLNKTNIHIINAHDALNDVFATAVCLKAFIENGEIEIE
jgi:DNA polymerase III epsilon subunit-like protein